MKKGINIWSFPGSLSIEECMRLAKKAGFDTIELALNEAGPLSLESSDDEILGYRRLADEIGIEIGSLASGLYNSNNFASDDPKMAERAMWIARKHIHAAHVLGVFGILMVPGAVAIDFAPEAGLTSYDKAYERSLKAMKELAPYAEEMNVHICLENIWNKFLLSPLEFRNFLDEIGSSHVHAYFDVANVVAFGYPEQWIRILGNRIRLVHFKDYRRNVGTLDGFVDLLAGDVNWKEVMKALREVGYHGPCTAEMIPGYQQASDHIIVSTKNAMDRIFAM